MPEHEIVINVGEETSVKKVKRMAGPGQFRNPDPTEILISGLKGRLKERNVIDEDKKSFYFTPKLDAGRDPQLEQEHKEKIEGNESLKKWINEGKGAILKEIMAPGGFGRDWHLTESFFTINVEEVVEAEKRELAAKKKRPSYIDKAKAAYAHVESRLYNPTSSYLNMKKEGDTSAKVDVILHGVETIGSAERSCNKEEMREQFLTISDGGYSSLLYDKFSKERVDREMDEFLDRDFFPRYGGGIGISRMISAMEKSNLL